MTHRLLLFRHRRHQVVPLVVQLSVVTGEGVLVMTGKLTSKLRRKHANTDRSSFVQLTCTPHAAQQSAEMLILSHNPQQSLSESS